MLNLAKRLLRDESGQGMAEYGLILALVAVALIGGLTALKNGLAGTFSTVTTAVTPAP
ncbi:MAG: Flp/Fap pilin component [Pelotomaculum sp. PtaU1.Bin035]|nr:MAG: Flp/Fap pilin component [Pelotomaculum sp. PtaU1.Bin035]